MTMFSVTDDIRPVSELKKRMREVFEQLHRTGRPVVITVNGKPDVVLLDVAVFEQKLKALNLSLLLASSEKDISKGRIRSARSFLKSFKRVRKISG